LAAVRLMRRRLSNEPVLALERAEGKVPVCLRAGNGWVEAAYG